MRLKSVFAVSAALLISTSAAFATNKTLKKPKAAPVVEAPVAAAPVIVAPPARSWTGLTVGLNGGYSFSGSVDDSQYGSSYGIASSMSGMTGGGQIGYDYQYDSAVIGVVADIDYSGANQSFLSYIYSFKLTETYNTTVRVKAGYLLNSDTLLYVTAGYAANEQKIEETTGTGYSETHLLSGYVVGAGAEHYFTSNISAFGEYRYSKFNSTSYEFQSDNPYGMDYSQSEVRVGFNYHF